MRPPIPPDQWTDPRHRLGLEAELEAAAWLERRSWTIEAHRWRLGRHDLDLVARKADRVLFVEVKRRRTARAGAGEESVGPRKRRVLERLAWSWILRHGRGGDRYRFDVITLAGPGGEVRVTHIPDAWRPGWRQ
jgi:putative endonuclease